MTEKEKYEYVSGKFLMYIGDDHMFNKNEIYWFDYIGDDKYCGRSDNILNRVFKITANLMVTNFKEVTVFNKQ